MNLKEFEQLKASLKTQKFAHAEVISGSMMPLIPVGTKIVFEPIAEAPNPLDIVVFWQVDKLVCHYVTHINTIRSASGELVVNTKGLRSPGNDLPLPLSHILGRVISHKLSFWEKVKIWLFA